MITICSALVQCPPESEQPSGSSASAVEAADTAAAGPPRPTREAIADLVEARECVYGQ